MDDLNSHIRGLDFKEEHRTSTMSVKIADLGQARILFDDQAAETTNCGTPYFMAPEVSSGQYNDAVDLWSIGVIFYWLVVGTYPFAAKNQY